MEKKGARPWTITTRRIAIRKASNKIWGRGGKSSGDENEKIITELLEPVFQAYQDAIDAWRKAANEAHLTLHQIAAIDKSTADCVAAAYNQAYIVHAAEHYSEEPV